MPEYLAKYEVPQVECCRKDVRIHSYLGSGFRLSKFPYSAVYEFEAKDDAQAQKIAKKQIKVLADSAKKRSFNFSIKIPKPTLERLLQIREIKLKR